MNSLTSKPAHKIDPKNESEMETYDSNRKLFNKELKDACKNIAKLKKPVAEIAKLVLPLGIPYYTVSNVFLGKSNHPDILEILTNLGIPHNRKPIRDTRISSKKRKLNKAKNAKEIS